MGPGNAILIDGSTGEDSRVRRTLFIAAALVGALLGAARGTAADTPSGASGTAPGAAPAPPPPKPEAPAPPAARGGLTLVRPRPVEILSGKQTIEAKLAPSDPEGAVPVVEFLVDGAVAGRASAPPYRVEFDFGDALRARKITARIVEGPGTGLRAEILTRGFDAKQIDQVARVDLVSLYVSVRDNSGKYVTDLASERFRVFDAGRPQLISHFGLEHRPLAAAIVIDTSYSMHGEPMEAAREAATRFVKSLAPEDRAMIVTFSDAPEVVADLTSDRDKAVAAISAAQAKGGTALYDAIYTAADRLSREDGRKVIILLSDGHDEAQNGIEPGSLHTFEESLEKSLRSEAILFTIGFGKKLASERDFYGRTSLKEILDRLALDSGGTSYYPQRTSQLKSAYELIGEELRNQYSIAYSPQQVRSDGAWHEIKVELDDRSLKSYTRRGYYAPKG